MEDKQNTLNNYINTQGYSRTYVTKYFSRISLHCGLSTDITTYQGLSTRKTARDGKKSSAIDGTSHMHHCDLDRVIFNISNRVLTARKKICFLLV